MSRSIPGCMSASSSMLMSRFPLWTTCVWSPATSRLTMHLVLRGLCPRLHDDEVDVHVGGTGGCPDDAVGHVVGDERSGHAGVDRVGPRLVTREADERELFSLHHAGRDIHDAHRLTAQLEAERLREGTLRMLRRGVSRAAFVDETTCRGRHRDDD